MFKNIKFTKAWLFITIILLFGCSDDEIIGTGFKYKGVAQKGPFVINSKVEVQPLDNSGLPTGQVIITETTDSLGNFSFTSGYKGPVRISTEGYHFNELTGQLSDGILRLNAIVDINGDTSKPLLVNVLTHLIYQRVLSLIAAGNISTTEAIGLAQQDFITQFSSIVEIDTPIDSFSQLSVYDIEGTNSDQNSYLLAISSALYQYATNRSVNNGSSVDAELTLIINSLSNDLSDNGIIDAIDILTQIKIALATLDPAIIAQNLQAHSALLLGTPLSTPNIDQYINQVIITTPANGAVISDITTIKLATPSGLNGVTYQLLVDGEVIDSVDAAPFEFQINPYYWSGNYLHTLLLQAVTDQGATINSNLVNIYIPGNIVDALSIVSPQYNSQLQATNSVTLSWNAIPYAANYDIQLSTGNEFNADQLLLSDNSVNTSIDSPVLATGMYYWRFRATNSHGQAGPWSNTYLFSNGLFSWRLTNGKNNLGSYLVVSDNGYFVVGATEDNSFRYDIYVLFLDFAGKKIWETVIGGSMYDMPSAATLTADGGILIDGWTSSYNNTLPYPYDQYPQEIFVKLDSQGNEIWRVLGEPNGFVVGPQSTRTVMDPPLLKNGTTFYWLRHKQDANDVHSYDLVVLDQDGTEISATPVSYPVVTGKNHIPLQLQMGINNSIIIAGSFYEPNKSVLDFDCCAFIQSIDLNGQTNWLHETTIVYTPNINILNDGNYVLTGYATAKLGAEKYGYASKISVNGDFLTTMNFSGVTFQTFTDPSTVTNSGLTLLAINNDYAATLPYELIEVDNQLNELSRHTLINTSNSVTINSITATNDGHFLLLGSENTSSNNVYSNTVLFKVTKQGENAPPITIDLSK